MTAQFILQMAGILAWPAMLVTAAILLRPRRRWRS